MQEQEIPLQAVRKPFLDQNQVTIRLFVRSVATVFARRASRPTTAIDAAVVILELLERAGWNALNKGRHAKSIPEHVSREQLVFVLEGLKIRPHDQTWKEICEEAEPGRAAATRRAYSQQGLTLIRKALVKIRSEELLSSAPPESEEIQGESETASLPLFLRVFLRKNQTEVFEEAIKIGASDFDLAFLCRVLYDAD